MGAEQIPITGRGAVETVFDSVRYTVRVHALAPTGHEAKDAARKVIDQFHACISEFGPEAGLDLGMIRSKFGVGYVRKDAYEPVAGYRASYEVTFEGRNVATATRMHDRLTSIVGLESPTLEFLVSDLSDCEEAAFDKAVNQSKQKFLVQCRALGLSSDDYEPVTWYVERNTGGGKTMALHTPETKAKPIGLEPGAALVEQVVTITYARKDRPRSACANT